MDPAVHIVCPHCDTINRVPGERMAAMGPGGGRCGECRKALFDGHPAALDTARFERHLAKSGVPLLIDFWASWCGPCRIEHAALERLAARQGVTLYGIDYKDKPENARAFLDELGNPFGKIDQDQEGRVSIDWGVTGVPETFVIDGKGVIRVHYAHPLDDEIINRLILPALKP